MTIVKEEINYLVERHLKNDWAILITIYVLAVFLYILSTFIVSFVSLLIGDILRWFVFLSLFVAHQYLYFRHKKYTYEMVGKFLVIGYLWLIELGLDIYSQFLLSTETKIVQAGYLFFSVIIVIIGMSFIKHNPWFFYESESEYYPIFGWVFILIAIAFFVINGIEYIPVLLG